MKKTTKILSAVALLLAALMLFSSCAITYRKADTSKYIQLTDGFDFRSFKLPSQIDKMVVTDTDVEEYINKELFALREKADENVNLPDEYRDFDILTIRTVLYDKNGNLVKTEDAVTAKGLLACASFCVCIFFTS